MAGHPNHLLEHFADVENIPATGSLVTDRHTLPEVGILVRFDEDIESAPSISLNVSGGRSRTEAEVDLRPDEAILLYTTLGAAIQQAIEGTNLDPARIASFYQEAR